MSLFNLKPERSTKPKSIHPWSKIIKNEFANKIEAVHNSVKNVVYPKPKEKVPSRHRVTFTLIGNMTTKEFIHCVHLVESMHKYKWKKFSAPVIRGYSEVEWSSTVLPDLKIKYGLLYCLKGQVAVLCNDECIGGEKELKDLIETKYYTCLVALNYQKEIVNQFAKFIKGSGLYSDIVPRTCENFLRLCRSTSGGYSGTPVHRVVKDGWIQCGGFALKSTDLPCENFIVPHDRRGVLSMANDGRHLDCSTQFFVLLQPLPHLKSRFVAFGQLVEGEETLKKIEQVNTYYEAPTVNITIYKAGVLNLDCRDIVINKGCQEYIEKHIDDLVVIGEMFYEMLLEKVFLDIEFKMIQIMGSVREEDEQTIDPKAFRNNVDEHGNYLAENIHATRRFIRKRGKWPSGVAAVAGEEDKEVENNDFDVEDYSSYYEAEEYSSVTPSFNIPNEPKPYYLAMTDVPYPGEIDSNFDLKRLLQGNYCFEGDLDPKLNRQYFFWKDADVIKIKKYSEIIDSYGGLRMLMDSDSSSSTYYSSDELDSIDEQEIKTYLEQNGDKVSFSGHIVTKIAAQCNRRNPLKESEWLTVKEMETRKKKHISIDVEPWEVQGHIKRRNTGFVRPMIFDDEDDEDDDVVGVDVDNNDTETNIPEYRKDEKRKVSLSTNPWDSDYHETKKQRKHDEDDDDENVALKKKILELQTKLQEKQQRKSNFDLDTMRQSAMMRPSVMIRLLDDVADEDNAPTLKDFKPVEIGKKTLKLAMSDRDLDKNPLLFKDNTQAFLQAVKSTENQDSSAPRKKLFDLPDDKQNMRHLTLPSLSSIDWQRKRPWLSVRQYQKMNEELRNKKIIK